MSNQDINNKVAKEFTNVAREWAESNKAKAPRGVIILAIEGHFASFDAAGDDKQIKWLVDHITEYIDVRHKD